MKAGTWVVLTLWVAGPDWAHADGRESWKACGARASLREAPMEAASRRLALDRELAGGGLTYCDYFLARACAEWETPEAGAGLRSFEMAFRVCEDRTVPARGLVASRLAREEYAAAYAALQDVSGRLNAGASPPVDSIHEALRAYAPAASLGLSFTDFGSLTPSAAAASEKTDPPYDPEMAYRLSLLPGAGFLYVDEPGLALRHAVLGIGLTSLILWRTWSAVEAEGRSSRMTAGLDAALIAAFLWRRYHLGGMREAKRLAREKNRRTEAAAVAALWKGLEPFRPDSWHPSRGPADGQPSSGTGQEMIPPP